MTYEVIIRVSAIRTFSEALFIAEKFFWCHCRLTRKTFSFRCWQVTSFAWIVAFKLRDKTSLNLINFEYLARIYIGEQLKGTRIRLSVWIVYDSNNDLNYSSGVDLSRDPI